MLAVSGNRTHLVLSRWTTAAATLLPSLEPSVKSIVILELMTEFMKTMFEYFRRSVAFVRAV